MCGCHRRNSSCCVLPRQPTASFRLPHPHPLLVAACQLTNSLPPRHPPPHPHMLHLGQHFRQQLRRQLHPQEGLPPVRLLRLHRRQRGAAAGRAAVVAGPAGQRVHKPAHPAAVPQHNALAVAAQAVGRGAHVACSRVASKSAAVAKRAAGHAWVAGCLQWPAVRQPAQSSEAHLRVACATHEPQLPPEQVLTLLMRTNHTCGAAVRKRFGRVVIVHDAALPAAPSCHHRRQPSIYLFNALQQAAAALAGVGCEDVLPSGHLVAKGPGGLESRSRRRPRCCHCCCSQRTSRRGGRAACHIPSRRRHRRLGWAGHLLLPHWRGNSIVHQELLVLLLVLRAGRLEAACWLGVVATAALKVGGPPPPPPAAAHAQPDEQHCGMSGQV